MPNAVVLEAQTVSFAYGARQVLSGVSLALSTGELVGIIGANGAGKTTLLNVLNGVLLSSEGYVLLGGKPLHRLSRLEVARRIAVVPQHTRSAFRHTVLEVVLMGRHPFAGLTALDTAEDLDICEAALIEVGLGGFQDRLYEELSGGEQRLVLVARALAQQPQILILDEPLAELDLRHQLHLMQLLRARVTAGALVLATFHDLNAAAKWCDRIALLSGGTIQSFGAPADVLEPTALQSAYQVPLTWSTTPHLDFQVSA